MPEEIFLNSQTDCGKNLICILSQPRVKLRTTGPWSLRDESAQSEPIVASWATGPSCIKLLITF